MVKQASWCALILILILIIVGAFAFYPKEPIEYTTTTTISPTTTTLVTTSTTIIPTTTTSTVPTSCKSACVALNYSTGTCRPSCLGPAEKPATTGKDCLSFQKCCCK